MGVSLSPDVSNWIVTNPTSDEVKYQLLFNTAGTKDVSVTILPEEAEVWNFPNPGTNTIAWILSADEPLSNTFNWADSSARETFINNDVSEHTFTGNASFSGVRHSNPGRIRKFASRLTGGAFSTNTYGASGNIDLSLMPNLLEIFVEGHHATFTNFNQLSPKLTQFYWWNNNVTASFVDLNISRLPNLVTFSARGTVGVRRGDFIGELHSVIPPSIIRYNVQHNSLS